MIVNSSEIENLYQEGFVLKKNILDLNQIKKIKDIITSNNEGKGVKDSHYSVTIQSFIIKLIKFNYSKIMVDGYYNKVQQNEILKWHSDQAYDGVKKIDKIFHPDYFHLKFFFYLSEVGPNNGCTSYIPGSHKITHAVRSCLYEGKIDYEPFWEITDLVNVINKKNNYIHIVNKLGSEKELINFLDKANLVLNKENSYFDFKASPGDLLIFNEGGIHRGSKPSLNERVVLRYLYL